MRVIEYAGDDDGADNRLTVLDCKQPTAATLPFGAVTPEAGQASIAFCRMAVKAAVAGQVDAVVAAPQNETSIAQAGIKKVFVRSPMTCEMEHGICATCYGRDLARGQMACTHGAVGIIAAQSIGEPGTQLTMRTFHLGGTAASTFKQPQIKSKLDANVRFNELRIVELEDGIEGLVHSSEISPQDRRILQEGNRAAFRVISIERDRRRLRLVPIGEPGDSTD